MFESLIIASFSVFLDKISSTATSDRREKKRLRQKLRKIHGWKLSGNLVKIFSLGEESKRDKPQKARDKSDKARSVKRDDLAGLYNDDHVR